LFRTNCSEGYKASELELAVNLEVYWGLPLCVSKTFGEAT